MKWKDTEEINNNRENAVSFIALSPIQDIEIEPNQPMNGSVKHQDYPRGVTPIGNNYKLRSLSATQKDQNDASPNEHGERYNPISTISRRRMDFDQIDGGFPSFSTLHDLEKNKNPTARDYFRKKEKRRAEWWLILISASLGIGNLWRFPNVAHQFGGGTFVFAYLLVVIFVAFPLCFLELSFGQFSSGNIGSPWRCLPILKGIVHGQKVVTIYSAILLSHVTSYSLSYMYESFSGPIMDPLMYNISNSSISMIDLLTEGPWNLHPTDAMPSELRVNRVIAVCQFIVWVFAFGTFIFSKFLKRAFLVTSVLPPTCFIGCLIYTLLQDGAVDGVVQFFVPRWDELKDIAVWYAAVQQAFFSLGIGFGHLIIFSQFNDFKHNILRDSIFICLIDTIISLTAGCFLFSVLGHVFYINNIEPLIGFTVMTSNAGYGLSFQVYAMILSKIETSYLAETISVVLFFSVALLGVANLVPVVDSLFDQPKEDKSNAKRKRLLFLFLTCTICFAIGILLATKLGSHVVISINEYGVGGAIIVFAIVECLGLMFGYGMQRLADDISFMLEIPIHFYWKWIWAFLAPFGLMIIFIWWHVLDVTSIETRTVWFIVNWSFLAVAVVPIPLWIIFMYHRNYEYGFKKKMAALVRVESSWGPSDPIHLYAWRKRKDKIVEPSIAGSKTSSLKRPQTGHHNKAFEDEIIQSNGFSNSAESYNFKL